MPSANSEIGDKRNSASSGTVSRTLQLLALLADSSGTVSVKHVAEEMGLAPSTAHRLLQLLRKEGFVQASAEGRQYSIGFQFYRVAARVTTLVTPAEVARPVIEEIAKTFGETVLFNMYLPEQAAGAVVCRADGGQRLTYQIEMHRPMSLLWGASGKSILAFLPSEVVDEVLEFAPHSPATGRSPPSRRSIKKELAVIKERGYAISEGENLPDARGIAAPVFGPRGVMGCICITSPKSRLPTVNVDRIGEEIVRRTASLSARLGGT